jgi:hypothetical protein
LRADAVPSVGSVEVVMPRVKEGGLVRTNDCRDSIHLGCTEPMSSKPNLTLSLR